MKFRLAHLSDFHLALAPRKGEWNAKRFLGRLNWILNRRHRHRIEALEAAVDDLRRDPPDVILVTGDAVQTGLPSEFKAVEQLFSPLTQAAVPVLLVSGNHDLYGSDVAGRSAFESLQQQLRLGLPLDAAGIVRLPVAADDGVSGSGGTVEILLMDQGYPCGLFRSNGRLAPGWAERLPTVWPRPSASMSLRLRGGVRILRLAAGHYPLELPGEGGGWDLRSRLGLTGLMNAEGLAGALAECGVLAYFCGHRHRKFALELPGGLWQYCADSTSRLGAVDRYRVTAGGGVEPEAEGR